MKSSKTNGAKSSANNPASNHGSAKPKPRGGRVKVADERVFARSRITNGKQLLPFVDGRSYWARIVRDTYNALVAHCGGEDIMSETERMNAWHCSVLHTELYFQASKFGLTRDEGGEPTIDSVDAFARIGGNQRRGLEALGWKRTQKDVTPDPLDYAKAFDRREAEEGEMEEVN